MSLKDIYRFAADNEATISFRAITSVYMPPTLEVVVRNEDYYIAERVRPEDLDNEDFIKYFMEQMVYKLKKHLEITGKRLCVNCGNRMCKGPYICEDAKNNIKYCLGTNRSLWVPNY